MSKHTPGPWRIERMVNPDGIEVDVILASGGWAKSGMGGCRTVAEVGHWRDRPNGAEDARLIAAAPEMLEVLETIENVDHNWLPEWLWDRIQAVTAKAKVAA